MGRDYSKLKELLETQETFPLDFIFKFIGRNSEGFRRGVRELEAGFPDLRMQTSRESGGGNHLALTYQLLARDSQEVIAVFERIARIEDVVVIL